jgi:hypothetical protein
VIEPRGCRRALRLAFALGLALGLALAASRARADDWSSADILGRPRAFSIESVRVRYTQFEQSGLGFQSQAGPVMGPGSEWALIEQPQLEVVAKQGENLTHRLWVPLDVVTAASPDALDAISTASRTNEAGSVDLTSTYRSNRTDSAFVRAGFHLEEPFRSWNLGAGWSRSLADDNALVALSVAQVWDWFDAFTIHGIRLGHGNRSTTNANLGLTQLLSPTTIVHVDYGGTVQIGTLGNTWNSVPLETGLRGDERLPDFRQRHALVGRIAQWLPWNGALHLFYRLYLDDWGIVGNTVEAELYQRLSPRVYVRLNYRVHLQRGADFFTTRADDTMKFRTADSDLDSFVAQTFGGKIALELPVGRFARGLLADVGYERYIRSNGLNATIVSCGLGMRF